MFFFSSKVSPLDFSKSYDIIVLTGGTKYPKDKFLVIKITANVSQPIRAVIFYLSHERDLLQLLLICQSESNLDM